MSIIARLQEFDGRQLGEDEHSDPIIGKLLPGLSKKELDALQVMLPCRLPEHIIELLQLTRGIEPSLDAIDFSGLSLADVSIRKELFPYGLPVAGDGAGNYWIVDLTPQSTDWGPVFYYSTNPEVIVWQAKTFSEFIAQLISFASFEEGSPIEQVHDKYAARIWAENPNLIPPEKTQEPGDSELGLFAQSLKKGYMFVDLRKGKTGDGLSWRRYAEKTELVRYGNVRLFAYRKMPNVVNRLFGY